MLNTSKGLAALLSGVLAILISLMVLLLANPGWTTFLTILLVGFLVGFFLIRFMLESVIFDPLEQLTARLKARGQSFADPEEDSVASVGPVRACIKEVIDFAAEKQREIDRLKKLEAFRKDFIADVSHELKTPIFAAQGFVHTLLDGAVKEKDVRKKFLRKAAKSLDGLDMLVQDLLTLSHIETGQIRMRFEDIDLYALTEDVFDQFKDKSNKKEVTLRIEGPVRKVKAYADQQRIRQVLTNLISNAVKHSDDEGEVIVSFSVRKKSVVTRIRDFGEGIAPEHTGRIFERFYRVDKSRSREKGGTGLGLAIVKHILEGHKSVPEVESAPGKGSTFSFKLLRSGPEKNENGETQSS